MSLTERFRRRLKKKRRTAKKPQKMHLEALEPRILLSADGLSGMAAAGAVVDPTPDLEVDLTPGLEDVDGTDTHRLIDSGRQAVLQDRALDETGAVDFAAGASPEADASASEAAGIRSHPSTPEISGRQIAFVDTGVDDHQTLIEVMGLGDGAASVVVVLDADSDGMEQITDYLYDAENISAIHILSHGSAGGLQLGSTRLDTDSLDSHTTQLAVWGEALAEDADILLYGCNVAAGQRGISFVE
ncbi:MAG: DUF4347 domain-containing protein, partial [bacterium]|nr:DUF4347 domain-containing protein [bacterium]